MFFRSLAPPLVLAVIPALAAGSRRAPSDRFVSTKDGEFTVNGTDLRYLGTTAYWLPALNTEQDIHDTLATMSQNGVKVVRTWAFNDVSTIPDDNTTWFQLISPDGTTSVNTGPNGLGKLDAIVSAAEELGIYVHLSLTNNWNPAPSNSTGNVTRPRNSLSNDYGGMDAYVRASFSSDAQNHDLFYTDEALISSFENYTTQVVSRYVESPAIFAWEIANDPRCSSTLPSTADCTPQTVTKWHARIAKHVRTIDPNHLIASGSAGFFCVECPKLYPRTTPVKPAKPAPSTRAVTGFTKRKPIPLTRSRLLSEKKRAFKVASNAAVERDGFSGFSIRGRWSAPVSRQKSDFDLGPAYNGVHGVDCEDILNIPEVSFGSFQLFPDQIDYSDSTSTETDPFNKTVEQGVEWIRRHAELSKLYGKPMSLTGFGLVTQQNAPFYVPFNSSEPFLSNSTLGNSTFGNSTGNATYGVTDEQRQEAYTKWINATIETGVSGAIHYQWGQSNLTAKSGSAIVADQSSTGQSQNVESTGISPNDGYTQEVSEASTQSFFNQASQEIGNSTSL